MQAICARCSKPVEVVDLAAAGWRLEFHKTMTSITEYVRKKGKRTLSQVEVTCTGSGSHVVVIDGQPRVL